MTKEYRLQGKRIADRRKELGYSQQEFSNLLETSQTTVSRWERGDMLPSGRYLKLLSSKLEVDPGYILLQQDEKKRKITEELSEEELALLDYIRVGDANNAIHLMSQMLKDRE